MFTGEREFWRFVGLCVRLAFGKMSKRKQARSMQAWKAGACPVTALGPKSR